MGEKVGILLWKETEIILFPETRAILSQRKLDENMPAARINIFFFQKKKNTLDLHHEKKNEQLSL